MLAWVAELDVLRCAILAWRWWPPEWKAAGPSWPVLILQWMLLGPVSRCCCCCCHLCQRGWGWSVLYSQSHPYGSWRPWQWPVWRWCSSPSPLPGHLAPNWFHLQWLPGGLCQAWTPAMSRCGDVGQLDEWTIGRRTRCLRGRKVMALVGKGEREKAPCREGREIEDRSTE